MRNYHSPSHSKTKVVAEAMIDRQVEFYLEEGARGRGNGGGEAKFVIEICDIMTTSSGVGIQNTNISS